MQSGFGFGGERFRLLVHIGCGESSDLGDGNIVDRFMLVEPDPDRARAARAWLQQTGTGVLVEAAVAEEDGDAAFRRTSFSDVNSLRVATGATALFPGLRALETCTVKTVQPRNLVRAELEKVDGGACGLIVDAPSEVLLVLDDLHCAGMLARFSHVIVRVPEEPLHEGGADRRTFEAWMTDAEYTVSWEEKPSDPDVRYGRVCPDWQTRVTRQKKQIDGLEAALEEARRSYAGVSEEAEANAKAYETALSERNELSAKCEALQKSLSQASVDLEASRAALAELSEERDGLRDAKAKVLKDSEANLQAFEAMRSERDRLKGGLSAATERAEEQAQALQRLSAELEELRDDNRLSLRIQRIAQADLADLQERYAALSGEKRELEVFLDELAENVAEAMTVQDSKREEQLEAPSDASLKSAASKPARRSRKSRAQSS